MYGNICCWFNFYYRWFTSRARPPRRSSSPAKTFYIVNKGQLEMSFIYIYIHICIYI